MSILGNIISTVAGNFLKPAASELGGDFAASLKHTLENTDKGLTTDQRLRYRTLDWGDVWERFLAWQKEIEDRPHILQATEAFSRVEGSQIGELILKGEFYTNLDTDKTNTLQKFGLVEHDAGIFLRIVALPLGLVAVLGVPATAIAGFFIGGEITGLMLIATMASWGLFWLLCRLWLIRVKLTDLGRSFVDSELLPALALFLEHNQKTPIDDADAGQ